MAATPGQPASDLPFLLRIPAEIRVNIYNRIFQPYRIDSCLEVVDSETTAKSQANVLFHGVLLSCKKIHAETRDIAPEAVMFVAGPQASGTTPKIIFWDVQIRYIAATVKLALSHTILGLIDLNAIAAQIPKLKLIEIHTPTRFLGVFELNFLEFDRLRSTVDIWEAECDGELLHSPAPPQEEIEYVEPHTCRFANFVAEQAPELIVHVREMIVIEDGLGEESYVLQGFVDIQSRSLVSLRKYYCDARDSALEIMSEEDFREWCRVHLWETWLFKGEDLRYPLVQVPE